MHSLYLLRIAFLHFAFLYLAFMPHICLSAVDESLSSVAHQSTWLNLLHYKKNLVGVYESAIHDKRFFLSPTGSASPTQELYATLAAMDLPVESDNTHVRCRFPARVYWIEKALGRVSNFDTSKHCSLYTKFINESNVQSISVVLASGYLKNPASFYGHTFIKFNTKDRLNSSVSNDLNSLTLSYGAIETQNDSMPAYIVKSLVGGYDAAFRNVGFYKHEQNYTENENRDLWDYELNLTKSEVAFVVNHAWEVLDQNYTYYFFRENCAFRMIELLEIIPGIQLTNHYEPYIIPQSTLQTLNKTLHHGMPLLGKVTYHPSRQSRFYNKYHLLNDDDRLKFKSLLNTHIDTSNHAFIEASVDKKIAIFDTIIDYFSFIEDSKLKQVSTRNPDYIKTLRLRFQLPASNEVSANNADETPHKGRGPSWVQLGSIHSDQFGSAAYINIRPAYYDQLDSNRFHVKNSALTMFETQIVAADNKLYLRKLDIFSAESVNPGITGLEGDKSYAWKAKFSIEQTRIDCLQCLTPKLQADYGYGKVLSNDLFVAGYIGFALQHDRLAHEDAFVRSTLETIYRPLESLAFKYNYEYRLNLNSMSNESVSNLTARLAPVDWFDFRVNYARQTGLYTSDVLQLGVGYFW